MFPSRFLKKTQVVCKKNCFFFFEKKDFSQKEKKRVNIKYNNADRIYNKEKIRKILNRKKMENKSKYLWR